MKKIASKLIIGLIAMMSLTSCQISSETSDGFDTTNNFDTTNTSTYTVTWQNYDGSILEVDEDVPYGSMPRYDGETPRRDSYNQYSYTFSGWSPEVSEVISNITYVAQFSSSVNLYTVTWQNYDGTILEVDEDVPYGSMPSYDGETPYKNGDYQYSYTFNGWSPEVSEVVCDVTYVAQFSYEDNLTYTLNSTYDGYVVSQGSNSANYKDIVIPNKHNNLPVTGIADSAFFRCYSLTSIYIPNSVTSIGDDAFHSCDSLSSVTFAENSQLESIGDNAFYNCCSLTSVTFAENSQLESIGDSAFLQCDSLTSIYIPNSVAFIGEWTFKYCYALVSVTFAENSQLESIGSGAFYNCISLMSINIPSSVTSIGEMALDGCTSLASVTFAENSQLESIGSSAFSSCTSLTSIFIPSSVMSIGDYAFQFCTSLIIYCEASSEPSGWSMFWNYYRPVVYNYQGINGVTEDGFKYGVTLDSNGDRCISIAGCVGEPTDIVVPSSIGVGGEDLLVKEICDFAFYNCTSLVSVTFAENSRLERIGDNAFYNCTSLASIVIPNSVISISDHALHGSTALIIYCEASSEPSGWSIFWNYPIRPVVYNYQGINGVTDNGLKYGVTLDSEGNKCITITGYIGESADVVIPSIINIGGEELPVKEITEIAEFSLYGWVSIASIVIPNSVTSIDDWAFRDCDSLTIYCEASSEPSGWSEYWNSHRPVVYNYQGIHGVTEDGFKYGVTLDSSGDRCISIAGYIGEPTDVSIPSIIDIGGEEFPVKEIAESSFEGCTSLTSIVIPNSITSINSYAFYHCTSLVSVTFAENSQLESIGYFGFCGCTSLVSIVIPNSVASIGNDAFWNCTSLTIYCEASSEPSGWAEYSWNYSYRPIVWNYQGINGVTEDGFSYAVTLDSSGDKCIVITGYIGELNDITIPSAVTVNDQALTVKEISENAFYKYTSLTSVVIPSSVTSIGGNAFYRCASLASVTFGENSQLESISYYAFAYCSSLTSIVIPSSVTSIGGHAFSDCISLASVVIPSSVTSIGYYAFDSCSSLSIYCEGSSSASGWETWWNHSNRPVVYNYQGINGVTEGGFKYAVTLDSNGNRCISITGYVGESTDVVIPSTINVGGEELPVKEICENAFRGCTSLTSVTFAENSQLESIGEHAFANCTSLTSIYIPNSVTFIDYGAFYGCISLTIYCEASSEPSGWSWNWNSSDRPVVWGC